jgi:hypothetical protein
MAQEMRKCVSWAIFCLSCPSVVKWTQHTLREDERPDRQEEARWLSMGDANDDAGNKGSALSMPYRPVAAP